MPSPILTYEFQNVIRDLSPVFVQIIESAPLFIRLVQSGAPAYAKKHEWLEDEVGVKKYTCGAAAHDADTLHIDQEIKFHTGIVFRLETPAGAHIAEQVRVETIPSSTTVTVTRGYGNTQPLTIGAGTVLIPVSRPRPESTEAGEDWGREPVTEHNFTQIFDRTAKVSGSAQAVKYYGITNQLNYQVQAMMLELVREINSQIIFGRRNSWDSGATGSFGGCMEYMEGGITDSTGGDISLDILNNLFEEIFSAGGMSNRYAILCHPVQARKISAFMTKDNIPVTASTAAAGHAVNKFYGDIPAFNGNPYEAFISVEPNLPRDRVLVLDLNKLSLAPLNGRAMKDGDATPPGADYFARRILGEYTLTFRNASTCHGQALGLSA